MTGVIEHRDIRETISSPLKPYQNQPLNPLIIPPSNSINTDEVDNSDYHFEAVRLQSFENWPLSYMDPAKLAAAGFYYTGESDKVRCFECQVEIRQWLEGDDPMVDHQRWSGKCRFIRGIPCGNVPIGDDQDSVPTPRPRSRDVCGPYGVEYRPGSGPDCPSTTSTNFQLPSSAKLGCFGISRPKGPVHPEFASYDARLRTFDSWPKSMPQTKEQLADAGFYYTGKGDQTLCYHCGGGLKDWEPEDDPWEQHAKWFSKCFYLSLVKGQEYINDVTGQHITPPSKEVKLQFLIFLQIIFSFYFFFQKISRDFQQLSTINSLRKLLQMHFKCFKYSKRYPKDKNFQDFVQLVRHYQTIFFVLLIVKRNEISLWNFRILKIRQ